MEVHHHPNVEKKSFKEYFLEFLMIFLAVTLGFFAETIRENITEHSRAKEFARSMIKDLEADTAQLRGYRIYFNFSANNVDTFMQLLSADEPKNIPSGKLYWYGLFGCAHRHFVSNDATFEQMKSSGSLRYFEKNIGTDAAKYDRLCRLLEDTEKDNSGIYTEARKSRALLFIFKYLEMANIIYQKGHKWQSIDSFTRSNPPLLTTDKVLFNQYVELARSRFMHINVAYADSSVKQANILLQELKEEYRLENE
ncbi:MAG TPA: hypothetical protein VK787_01485 [Puia sp.]|jgi:hypothetical protein|nr:hypothetical protein [Puia sp.]